MARNVIWSEFRTFKMADGSHFVKKIHKNKNFQFFLFYYTKKYDLSTPLCIARASSSKLMPRSILGGGGGGGPTSGPVVERSERCLLSHRDPPSWQMLPSLLSCMAIYSATLRSLNQAESIYENFIMEYWLMPICMGSSYICIWTTGC